MSDVPPDPQDTGSSVKETITSLTISFIFAFVFRGFIVEAFMIPTGSMAPTLMGAHMRLADPETGYVWPVGPSDVMPDGQTPVPIQGAKNALKLNDPMSGEILGGALGVRNVPATAGDRIFVLKYLKGIVNPQRWDAIVFHSPNHPEVNFIKRLIGLPGEQVAFVDGDLFTREAPDGGQHPVAGPGEKVSPGDTWSQPGWHIQRKPESVQRAVWQNVFDSVYSSSKATARRPWQGKDSEWDFSAGSSYAAKTDAPATLTWDSTRWPVLDTYPYNQNPYNGDLFDRTPDDASILENLRSHYGFYCFPVSDLCVGFNIKPDKAGVNAVSTISARGSEFRARIESGTRAVLEMRASGAADWIKLAEGSLTVALQPGVATRVEFWHVDQSLALYVDDHRELYAEYDWTPAERIGRATSFKMEELSSEAAFKRSPLVDQSRYRRPEISLQVSGSPSTLYHVSLARDLHYQAVVYPMSNFENRTAHSRGGLPAAATSPWSAVTLNGHEFFCCGDNSPASSDCRLWDVPEKWVAERINPQFGVVDERLTIGKAFVVYLPGIGKSQNMPMIDFGRMRWIW